MTVAEFCSRLEQVTKIESGWSARCPAHEDRRSSLSVGEGREGQVLLFCHAGCSVEEIVSALGLKLSDLFPRDEGSSYPPATRATVQQSSNGRGCTIEDYASAKGFSVAFLQGLGVAEVRYLGAPAVRFPYLDASGEEICVRFRVSLDGDLRVRTKAGAKHHLYGLNRLRDARAAGYVVLVEGESDTQTLWQAGYPALGLPGANGWNEGRDAEHLEGVPTVYVVIEPDRGGETVLRWISASSIRERVRLVTFLDAKDVSELYLADQEAFPARIEQALQSATPWAEHEKVAAAIQFRTSWASCAQLAHESDILKKFAEDLASSGLAGEQRAGKLLYLVLTSRFLPRPVSTAVKGPSSGGKSYLVETTTSFFPPDAFYALTAMSEHALAYGTEPLEHRFLILYEAAGLEGEFATYLVRSLLSEGRVRYETVEKTADGLAPRLIEREGPTGLLTTTTKIALHPENETRLLSIPITDTADQTRDVLLALAGDDDRETIDVGSWAALQRWLAVAEHRVTVPYARALAELVPPIAVRLRRDFGAILNLIRAHALLHQATRERDSSGRVIATIADYAAVLELVEDLVSQGVEATVAPIVRETVAAVTAIGNDEGVSIARLAAHLHVDKSVASRRWQAARAGGYLKNLETARGKPARIVLADALPEDVQVLPSAEAVADRCTVAGVAEGEVDPPPPKRIPGDKGYLEWLWPSLENGHITPSEWTQLERAHRVFIEASKT